MASGTGEGGAVGGSRRRRIGWALAAAALAAVVAAPFLLRARGRAALAEVRARLAAEGRGSTAADTVPPGLAADPVVQRHWQGLVARLLPLNQAAGKARLAAERRATGEPAAPDPAGEKLLESRLALRRELRDFLVRNRLVAGTVGARLAGTASARPWSDLPQDSNFLAINIARNLLVAEALEGEDPAAALAALDSLHAAWAHPGTLIEAMIALTVASGRDEARTLRAVAGLAPDPGEAAWLDEESAEPGRVADGLRGERLAWLGPVLDAMESGALPLRTMTTGAWGPAAWTGIGSREPGVVHWWLFGAAAGAVATEGLAAGEAALRAGVPPPATPGTRGIVRDMARALGEASSSCAVAAHDRRAMHRAARAFLLLVREGARRGGALPADDGEARAWLGPRAAILDPGPLDRALLVERLPGDRLRVAIRRGPQEGALGPWLEERSHAGDETIHPPPGKPSERAWLFSSRAVEGRPRWGR